MTRSNRRGAAAIEFALVLPIMIALAFGIIEYGWVFFQQANLQSAVREGARMGITVATTASPDPVATAITRTNAVLDAYNVPSGGRTINATFNGASPQMLLVVTATVNYSDIVGLVPAPPTLSAQMSMLLEAQP